MHNCNNKLGLRLEVISRNMVGSSFRNNKDKASLSSYEEKENIKAASEIAAYENEIANLGRKVTALRNRHGLCY